MARYTGPKHRLARREGINILDKNSASLKRRLNIPPGLHGRKRHKRLSEYGLQLREKQKVKATYGILERQFKKIIDSASKKRGDTGEILMSLLETRLDNVIYRLGFAKTRTMARQLVSHGHAIVNGKRINIPSYSVKIDDVVSLSPKIQKTANVSKILEEKSNEILPFLQKKGVVGKLVRYPKKEDLQIPFNLQLIIEYYSR
ncbi:MAG: 30S ribosomal protein S4 [Candidatus Levybacteria bacterium RIFCSPLOWO2_02_FULL_37_10]|nr:MAG: 30S ribosomal protein S4 [Candidatus Levybacteria bacterium RIFCSPHIGHO2_01_FULL_37_33]OGH15752.1 MAG: 30S ribosomal protein S4 [Candidatus Levybacteria bacterium RIFCSPHIGHO2_02_FULL_37_11]OGH29669.1 MAG: 30S ribosomal protein S4 [Candidatus Levybacteria bacterium RIFCSPHIGHO2_12_FULL_37_12]OGH32596.1 MAG: 30S ribosomal protein S4 [Candidatus Levybacteria bacterium RIFCSPLOWO2_01_FULL_36_54]OGH43209.1 MAG: 30S ribosomal protein S4 [Candidatus Levybacteria bacterium RIFCSPLOWO2_02_FULL_